MWSINNNNIKMIFSHIFLVFQEHQFGEVQQINQKFSTPHLLSSFTTKKCFLEIRNLSILPRYSQIVLWVATVFKTMFMFIVYFSENWFQVNRMHCLLFERCIQLFATHFPILHDEFLSKWNYMKILEKLNV